MQKTTMLSRRHLLAMGAGAAVSLPLMSTPALAAREGTARLRPRSLSFYNTHTGEKLETTYWANGRYVPGSLSQINWILRDFRSGDIYQINRDLLDLLYKLHSRLETRNPFMVVSGYRSPKTNAHLRAESSGVAKNSFHMRGMAMDLFVEGRSLNAVRGIAHSFQAGGVGYYPTNGFVHVDCGPVRTWGA